MNSVTLERLLCFRSCQAEPPEAFQMMMIIIMMTALYIDYIRCGKFCHGGRKDKAILGAGRAPSGGNKKNIGDELRPAEIAELSMTAAILKKLSMSA